MTVPLFNLWSLSWVADRVPHGLGGVWDAPIFAPQRGTFAWSEPQLPTGVVFAMLQPFFGPVAAYALVVLVTITLNGVFMARLARQLGASTGPATLAGFLAQSLPFVAHELGVLQLTMLWPTVGVLAATIAWRAEPRARHAAAAGVFAGLTVLTCGYYGLYLLFAAATAPLLLAGPQPPHVRTTARASAIAIGAAIVVAGLPLAAQSSRTADRGWSDATILMNSATWSDWGPAGDWWPGWLLAIGGLAGIWIGRRQPCIRWLAALAVSAFFASLGSRLSVLGVRPWTIFVDHVPGFDRLRSPFRAAAVAQLALFACSVPLLTAAWSVLIGTVRSRVANAALLVAGGVLVVIPAVIRPTRLAAVEVTQADGVTAFLAATADRDTVAALPFAPTGRTGDFEPTVAAMLDALDHGHPLVNGYSGFFPTDHGRLRRALSGFPDGPSLAALEQRDVRWVLVDERWLSASRRSRLARWPLAIAYEDDDWLVVQVIATDPM